MERRLEALTEQIDEMKSGRMEKQLEGLRKEIAALAKRQIEMLVKPSAPPAKSDTAPVINVTVDAKTGKVKKSFTMKKTPAGAYEGTVTETESE